MAPEPPKYLSTLFFFKARNGSFPDLPNASQKTYSSIITSPITKIFLFLRLFISLTILLKFDIFLIFKTLLFCSSVKKSSFELIILDELNNFDEVVINLPPAFSTAFFSKNIFCV